MILKLYRVYKTGKTLYTRVLKPIYEDLRKDAYELDKKGNKKPRRKSKYSSKSIAGKNAGMKSA